MSSEVSGNTATANGGGEESGTVTSPGGGGGGGSNKVKFLCSHGGKILPRPPDGLLKYVGGETRVIAVPRDISFSDLMKKLSSMSEGNMVLKYQVLPEDLDTLVSVTCDEDLQNMLAEYDRQCKRSSVSENNGSPMLRSFLFPSRPLNVDHQLNPETMDTHELEQHYIDAINGVLRAPTTIKNFRSTSRKISSAGSSPRSVQNDGHPFDHVNHDGFVSNSFLRSKEMPRVNSSPSLYNLGQQQSHYYHPAPPSPVPAHQQHPYHSSTGVHVQCNNGSGQQMGPVILAGRGDFPRYQMGYTQRPPRYFHQGMPTSNHGSCGHGDDYRIYKSGGLEMVIPSGSVGP